MKQKGGRFEFDVVVFGSGIAGLTYILDLLDIRPKTRVALITKLSISESNSRYAQGGIAAVSEPDDSLENHVRDTLQAGDGLCNADTVRQILREAPQRISDLVRRGVRFDQSGADYLLALEGGHSHRRIFRAGDHTGSEIIRGLTERVRESKQVQIFENHTAVNLITQGERHTPGGRREVIGAYVLDEKQEVIHLFQARAVILATGGAGKIFRYTSNPDIATGDGIAMAYRADARVGNMEFYQFHPTLLYHTKVNNFLISESLRGEGAYLVLPSNGERFMARYAPQEMELATRDKVARAIFSEIETGSHAFLYLDIRHKGRDFIEKRFPLISTTLRELGLDLAKDLIPVVPAAHYCCGGVLTDVNGQTDLLRLFAIGETAFTGMHGANRLASNSLIEAAVMAHGAARQSAAFLDAPPKLLRDLLDWNSQSVTDLRRASQINAHWRGLRGEMTSYAGIVRTAAGLSDLLKIISARREIIEGYYWKHTITRDLIELRNIAQISELIVRSALRRHESRGVHFREDFPKHLAVAQDSILRFNEVFPIATDPFERPEA